MSSQKETKKHYTIDDLRILADEYWIYLGGVYPKKNTSYHDFISFIQGKNPRFAFLRLIIQRLKRLFNKRRDDKRHL